MTKIAKHSRNFQVGSTILTVCILGADCERQVRIYKPGTLPVKIGDFILNLKVFLWNS